MFGKHEITGKTSTGIMAEKLTEMIGDSDIMLDILRDKKFHHLDKLHIESKIVSVFYEMLSRGAMDAPRSYIFSDVYDIYGFLRDKHDRMLRLHETFISVELRDRGYTGIGYKVDNDFVDTLRHVFDDKMKLYFISRTHFTEKEQILFEKILMFTEEQSDRIRKKRWEGNRIESHILFLYEFLSTDLRLTYIPFIALLEKIHLGHRFVNRLHSALLDSICGNV